MKIILLPLLFTTVLLQFYNKQAYQYYVQYCNDQSLLEGLSSSELNNYQQIVSFFPKSDCCSDFVNNNQTNTQKIHGKLIQNALPFLILAFFTFLLLIYVLLSLIYYDKFHFDKRNNQKNQLKSMNEKYLIFPAMIFICFTVGSLLFTFIGLPWSVQQVHSQNKAYCQLFQLMNVVQNGNISKGFQGIAKLNGNLMKLNNFLNDEFFVFVKDSFQDNIFSKISNKLPNLNVKIQQIQSGTNTDQGKFLNYLLINYFYPTQNSLPGGNSKYIYVKQIMQEIQYLILFLSTIEKYQPSSSMNISQVVEYYMDLQISFVSLTDSLHSSIITNKNKLDSDRNGLIVHYIMVIIFSLLNVPCILLIIYKNYTRLRNLMKITITMCFLINFTLFIISSIIHMRAAIINDGCVNIYKRINFQSSIYTTNFLPHNVLDLFIYILFPFNINFYRSSPQYGSILYNLTTFGRLIFEVNMTRIPLLQESVVQSTLYMLNAQGGTNDLEAFQAVYGTYSLASQCESSTNINDLCGIMNMLASKKLKINHLQDKDELIFSQLKSINLNLDPSAIMNSVDNSYNTICVENLGQIYRQLIITWLLAVCFLVTNMILFFVLLRLEFKHKLGQNDQKVAIYFDKDFQNNQPSKSDNDASPKSNKSNRAENLNFDVLNQPPLAIADVGVSQKLDLKPSNISISNQKDKNKSLIEEDNLQNHSDVYKAKEEQILSSPSPNKQNKIQKSVSIPQDNQQEIQQFQVIQDIVQFDQGEELMNDVEINPPINHQSIIS